MKEAFGGRGRSARGGRSGGGFRFEQEDLGGGQDIAAAGEAKGDFANADKPMPRVRTVGGGSVFTEEHVVEDEGIPIETVTTRRRVNTDLNDNKEQ